MFTKDLVEAIFALSPKTHNTAKLTFPLIEGVAAHGTQVLDFLGETGDILCRLGEDIHDLLALNRMVLSKIEPDIQ